MYSFLFLFPQLKYPEDDFLIIDLPSAKVVSVFVNGAQFQFGFSFAIRVERSANSWPWSLSTRCLCFAPEVTKIIYRRPHIATYVRSIEMRDVFPRILSMMTLLKKIKFNGSCRWQGILEHFRQAFSICLLWRYPLDVSPIFLYLKKLTCEWQDDE